MHLVEFLGHFHRQVEMLLDERRALGVGPLAIGVEVLEVLMEPHCSSISLNLA